MPATYAIPQHLETEESFRTILRYAQEMNQGNEVGEADEFRLMLQQRVANDQAVASQPQLRATYQQVLRYLKFVTLHLLTEPEVVDLFQHHLLYGLTTDVDLKTKLELLFLSSFDDVLDMTLRRRILYALTENDEQIGGRSLNIPDLPGPTPPSIKFWIIDFLRIASAGQIPTQLELAGYFTQAPNVKLLSVQERDVLRQVLSLYLYILNPTLSDYALNWFKYSLYRQAAPTAAPGPVNATAPTAVQEPAAPALAAVADFRSALLQDLFEESALEEAVYEEEQRLLKSVGYDTEAILVTLKEALRTRSRSRFQAALFLLARSGELKDLLARDGELQQWVEREVLPALLVVLKAKRTNLRLDVLVEDFRRQPTRPAYLKSFLETALKQVIRGDEELSAKVGVRLASFLFQEGFTQAAGIAFYDRQAHRFCWGTVDVDSQGVPVLT